MNYANMSRAELLGEVERLDSLINHPTTDAFLSGVRLEAAHQAERWGIDHDAGKGPVDWLFLVSYLAGKAAAAATGAELPYKVVHAAVEQVYDDHPTLRPWQKTEADATIMADAVRTRLGPMLEDKAKHHTITAAAALANWHAQLCGQPLDPQQSMRPGINPAEHGEPIRAADIAENDLDEVVDAVEALGWTTDDMTPGAQENSRAKFREALATFLRERGVRVQHICDAHELPCDENGECQMCREAGTEQATEWKGRTRTALEDFARQHDGRCKVAKMNDGHTRFYPPEAHLPFGGLWAWYYTAEPDDFPFGTFNIVDDREGSPGYKTLHRCAHPDCPGYPYRASEHAHPPETCAERAHPDG